MILRCPKLDARAETLLRMLRDSEISAIFTTEFKRTKETATPTAIALKISPTVVRAKETATLANKLREQHGNALVVAHGNTIPDLIKALGIDVPVNIPKNDYDHFFIVAVGSQPRLLPLRYL
jgi:broad specificity phosphatase PhoE